MRIAVIADIHGNLPALEAVHTDLRGQSADLIVNLGDCVSAPLWPQETAAYLIAEDWLTVRGNNDRKVTASDIETMSALNRLVRESLSPQSIDWLAALPLRRMVGDDVLLCHGSPDDDETFLLEEDDGSQFFPSNEAQIRRKAGSVTAGLVLCGHSHVPRVVRLADGLIAVNPGSVGVQAFPGLTVTGSPHARYALATRRNGGWDITQRIIPYDWTAAGQRAHALGFANWAHTLSTGFAVPAA